MGLPWTVVVPCTTHIRETTSCSRWEWTWRPMHNRTMCREQETLEHSVLNGISPSTPLHQGSGSMQMRRREDFNCLEFSVQALSLVDFARSVLACLLLSFCSPGLGSHVGETKWCSCWHTAHRLCIFFFFWTQPLVCLFVCLHRLSPY